MQIHSQLVLLSFRCLDVYWLWSFRCRDPIGDSDRYYCSRWIWASGGEGSIFCCISGKRMVADFSSKFYRLLTCLLNPFGHLDDWINNLPDPVFHHHPVPSNPASLMCFYDVYLIDLHDVVCADLFRWRPYAGGIELLGKVFGVRILKKGLCRLGMRQSRL